MPAKAGQTCLSAWNREFGGLRADSDIFPSPPPQSLPLYSNCSSVPFLATQTWIVRIILEAGGSSGSIAWTDPSPDLHLMLLSGLTCSALIPCSFPAKPALHQTSQSLLVSHHGPTDLRIPCQPVGEHNIYKPSCLPGAVTCVPQGRKIGKISMRLLPREINAISTHCEVP